MKIGEEMSSWTLQDLDEANSLVRELRDSAQHDLRLCRQSFVFEQTYQRYRTSAEQKIRAASAIERMVRALDNET